MKNYFNIILIASVLLLIFPFLAFPELLENIYVVVFSFIIAYSSMLLRHKVIISEDEESSLQDYIKDLKEKFKKHEDLKDSDENSKRISDITIDEK